MKTELEGEKGNGTWVLYEYMSVKVTARSREVQSHTGQKQKTEHDSVHEEVKHRDIYSPPRIHCSTLC